MTNETKDGGSVILASVVGEDDRFAFPTKQLGDFGVCTEYFTHQVLREMATSYCGGHWDYFQLSNGGCFIAPSVPATMRLVIGAVQFDRVVSCQSAGIIATAFGINRMIETAAGSDSTENPDYPRLRDQICKLYDYVAVHPDRRTLYAAFK